MEAYIFGKKSERFYMQFEKSENKEECQGAQIDTYLLKRIEKEDETLDKNRRIRLRNENVRNGWTRSNFRKLDNLDYRSNVRTTKPGGTLQQKRSPEQLLEEAVRQTRAGRCTHCTEEGHFYRECPSFWEKVKESRRANLKP